MGADWWMYDESLVNSYKNIINNLFKRVIDSGEVGGESFLIRAIFEYLYEKYPEESKEKLSMSR